MNKALKGDAAIVADSMDNDCTWLELLAALKRNQNKEVMYCYYMAIKDKPRGYRKRMHQLWIERQNFECTEQ